MDRVFALLSAAMFAVMLSSVALFLMIVEGRAEAVVLAPTTAAQPAHAAPVAIAPQLQPTSSLNQ